MKVAHRAPFVVDTASVTPSRRTVLAAAIVVLLAVAGLLVPTPASSAAAPSGWRYTMVAFSNASARDMDVYESSDGLEYTLVRRSAYRPPTGYVRDASIFRHTDGW